VKTAFKIHSFIPECTKATITVNKPEETLDQWVMGQWVNKGERVAWVTGQYRKTLDP